MNGSGVALLGVPSISLRVPGILFVAFPTYFECLRRHELCSVPGVTGSGVALFGIPSVSLSVPGICL